MWAHQYLQAINEINAIKADPHVWRNDGDEAETYGLEPNYGCCTANFNQGWPKYANSLVFKSVADGGVAVVRFDPRDPRDGVGLDTLRRDIRAAGEWLSARQEVDAGRVAVIGHGQGALLGVLAAQDRPDLFRAIVGLAPPARPLREAMVARLRARLRANALSAEAMDAAEQRLNEELDALRDGTESGAQRLMRELLPRIPSDDYLGTKAQLLLLFGARDEEIPPGHRGLLQTAVALYGGKNVDLQVIPGADHEFLERDGGRGSSGAADLARRRHPSLIPVIRSFLETALAKKR